MAAPQSPKRSPKRSQKRPASGRAAPARWLGRAPLLEWVVSGLGLALVSGAAAVVLWHGTQPADPPAIRLRAVGVERTAAGFVVEVEAANGSPSTAAAVEIEGRVSAPGRPVETSTATIDYLPGHGRRTAGLVFENDPRSNELKLRTRGFARP